jgi:hypothetical protein
VIVSPRQWRPRTARIVLPIAMAVTAVGPQWLEAGRAEASGVGPLHPLRCTPMSSDPALEAPLYAQEEGAGGGPDGWWCQLPHATEMPAGFVQLQRGVAPLANLYAVYSTNYGNRGSGGASIGSATKPGIVVSADVNSSVAPPAHLQYPPAPRGKKVVVARGVTGTMVVNGGSATLTWRYPTSGVPRYLRAVATVTVSGTGVTEGAVLNVARHVTPD